MVGYGGWTSSRKNVARLRSAGFGMVVTPKHPKEPALGIPYMVDNGAYYLWERDLPFDDAAFSRMVDAVLSFGRPPDFAVCPDKVAGGYESLEVSESWLPRLPAAIRWYLAVQDGMEAGRVRPLLGRFAGVFVGGTSEWKLNSAPEWVRLAHGAGLPCHIGRVNSLSRAFYVAGVLGAESFDGTSWHRTYEGRPDKHPGRVVSGRSQLALDLFGLRPPLPGP